MGRKDLVTREQEIIAALDEVVAGTRTLSSVATQYSVRTQDIRAFAKSHVIVLPDPKPWSDRRKVAIGSKALPAPKGDAITKATTETVTEWLKAVPAASNALTDSHNAILILLTQASERLENAAKDITILKDENVTLRHELDTYKALCVVAEEDVRDAKLWRQELSRQAKAKREISDAVLRVEHGIQTVEEARNRRESER